MNNLCLYAKRWYKEDNLIEDLHKVLRADGYQPEGVNDIHSILSGIIERIIENKPFRCRVFLMNFQSNTEKYDWKYEPFIRAVLSSLHFLSAKEIKEVFNLELKAPDFTILPKGHDVTNAAVEITFA